MSQANNKITTALEQLSGLTTVCPKCNGRPICLCPDGSPFYSCAQSDDYISHQEHEQGACPYCTDGRVKLFDLTKDCANFKYGTPETHYYDCWVCKNTGKVLAEVHLEDLLEMARKVRIVASQFNRDDEDTNWEALLWDSSLSLSPWLGAGDTTCDAAADALLQAALTIEGVA